MRVKTAALWKTPEIFNWWCVPLRNEETWNVTRTVPLGQGEHQCSAIDGLLPWLNRCQTGFSDWREREIEEEEEKYNKSSAGTKQETLQTSEIEARDNSKKLIHRDEKTSLLPICPECFRLKENLSLASLENVFSAVSVQTNKSMIDDCNIPSSSFTGLRSNVVFCNYGTLVSTNCAHNNCAFQWQFYISFNQAHLFMTFKNHPCSLLKRDMNLPVAPFFVVVSTESGQLIGLKREDLQSLRSLSCFSATSGSRKQPVD